MSRQKNHTLLDSARQNFQEVLSKNIQTVADEETKLRENYILQTSNKRIKRSNSQRKKVAKFEDVPDKSVYPYAVSLFDRYQCCYAAPHIHRFRSLLRILLSKFEFVTAGNAFTVTAYATLKHSGTHPPHIAASNKSATLKLISDQLTDSTSILHKFFTCLINFCC